ncbi:MAG: hypothetical protein NTV73_13295 [Hyphomicrobiales bacterium]|nr:hypothetical protein [Hyphomicrobiales bacterium]
MTYRHAAFRKLALSAILLAIPAGSAFAQDVTAVAERLKALATGQGIALGWSAVSGDASKMVLEGVTVKGAGETDATAIGDVTLSGISTKGGGYVVDTLTTAPFTMAEQGVSVDISPFVVKGLSIPAADAADPMSSFTMYQSASLDSLSVKMGGKTAFALQGVAGSVTPPDGTSAMQFSGAVQKFTTDLSLIEDQSVKSYIDGLGYSQLDGNIKISGSWQPTDGRWSMSQYDIAINDVGTLGMTLDLGGMTPGFVKTVNELSTKMAEAPEGADTSAQQAQLMGMLQDATFHGASLKFSDDSLTDRAVKLVAMLQGAQPADVVTMAKAAIPFAMMQFQMGELAGTITPAVNAFLDNPKSIEITATPPAPVTFAKISEVSMATPGDSAATTNAIWSLLEIKVNANQ